jgi:mono/diheme cytochrome c family protein
VKLSVQRSAYSVQGMECSGAPALRRSGAPSALRRLGAPALLMSALLTSGCSWLSDFREQPSVGPWQTLEVRADGGRPDSTTPFRGNPQGSVSIEGTAVAEYEVSYRGNIATIDSMKSLANPEAPTQESVNRGWKYYQINCAVCHGEAGLGDGPVARFNGAPNLSNAITAAKSDGYYFGQIRNGGTIMPSFNRIPERDRWHVINYVRGLQGKLPAEITIRKEAVALPGITGEALPGPSPTSPQIAPFVKPAYTPTGGAAATQTTPGKHQ